MRYNGVGSVLAGGRRMAVSFKDSATICGIGLSQLGRGLPDTQLELAAVALKAALTDAGLSRDDIDGLAVNFGWPLGLDYDRIAESFGLDIRWVNQFWTHGRFVTMSLQAAAMAVSAGLADVVACVTAASFTREREILGGPGDIAFNTCLQRYKRAVSAGLLKIMSKMGISVVSSYRGGYHFEAVGLSRSLVTPWRRLISRSTHAGTRASGP